MKRIALLTLLAGLLTAAGTMAQTTSTTATMTPAVDTTVYRDYVGKYTMTGASFETVIITVENGKLVGEAVGAGKGELVADEKTPDTYIAPDYDVTITFPRETDKQVKKIKMAMQGQEFTGEKQL
ncbi:MAG: DUF3471 domain-containing protein [Cytophagaceae bacterium]|nr:DUF3471 domain-containing protein [Cytophagaceae bacterium]